MKKESKAKRAELTRVFRWILTAKHGSARFNGDPPFLISMATNTPCTTARVNPLIREVLTPYSRRPATFVLLTYFISLPTKPGSIEHTFFNCYRHRFILSSFNSFSLLRWVRLGVPKYGGCSFRVVVMFVVRFALFFCWLFVGSLSSPEVRPFFVLGPYQRSRRGVCLILAMLVL